MSTLATFNDDLLHVHREALRAIREILSDPTLAAKEPEHEDDKARAKRRFHVQRISLRLRAAIAALRIKPLGTAPATKTPDVILQAISAATSFAASLPSRPAAALTAAAGAPRPAA
ncbi:MAG: hypothetical protein QM783_08525 [Phycisphaerales bacterium]